MVADSESEVPSPALPSSEDCTYIHFIVEVSIKTAEKVTKGLDRLEDILVLHLNNGKDYFVSSASLSLCGCGCGGWVGVSVCACGP